MNQRRRKFLRCSLAAVGTTVGLSSWWLSISERRTARWARTVIADARRKVPPAPARPAPDKWSDNAITLAWLGHATVLINFYGIRILTDPTLGNRIGIGAGLGTLGPKRYVASALRFDELPPIDLVLLSHAHMDHMDIASLGRFSKSTVALTAKDTGDIFAGTRLKGATELAWNERAQIRTSNGVLEVEAFPVKHWGQRWPRKAARGYNGYVLRREGKALLFGGDTAETPSFRDLRGRGPFVAALMPIGAYQPWIWNHCTPEQAFAMANAAGASYVVPVHHQTFKLSDEPFHEPLARLEAAMQREPERLAVRKIGETLVCPVT